MQILFNSTKINTQNKGKYNQNIFTPVYPSPSFKMKMSELRGIDKFVARKYKINPQPIKTLQEFQEKCKELVDKISGKDFSGRQKETQVQRKAMIKDWYDYVVKENGAYTGAMALMILGGITAGLKPKEDTLPPVLNKGALADTVTNIQEELKKDEKVQLNFEKEYRLNLQKGIFREEKELDESLNGWIIIPSKEHDPNNFKANVDKLKMLSHDNWCTKSFNAEPYLEKGDFHVYMEKGKPKLGVRFVEDEIQEIQGELNNSRIPLKYEDITKEHIKNYELTYNARNELKKLEKTKIEIEKIKSKFPKGINNAPTKEVLEALGIKCKKISNGLLIISHYGDIDFDYTYSDLEIDENRLFKDIKAIEKDADFRNTEVTNLGSLQSIGGNADFSNSQITSLGNLQRVGRSTYFMKSQVTDLGKLQSIGGDAHFSNSQITSLGNLQKIKGDADFAHSQVTDLGDLVLIGRYAFFRNSELTNLGNLESIGRDAYFWDSQITNLGNLQTIGRDAYIDNTQLKEKDFEKIKIGGELKK